MLRVAAGQRLRAGLVHRPPPQTLLGVRAGVEVVPANTFERFEHKSRRVTDEREHMRRST